jgi:DNA-binding transcriptional MerR regulator
MKAKVDKPQKNPDNNYRNYSEEEVRKLIIINILRRLDVPIKSIGDIIKNSVSIKEVLKDQLILTNRKINVLLQNKKIMNDLITRDMEESDFTFSTLKEFNAELDKLSDSKGQVGKELEIILSGTLGKPLRYLQRFPECSAGHRREDFPPGRADSKA